MGLVSTSTGTLDPEHLTARVRLYLLVMLSIDGLAYISDFINPYVIEGFQSAPLPTFQLWLRWSVTALMATAWLILKYVRLPRRGAVALEVAVTLALVWSYVEIGLAYLLAELPDIAPVFALLGIILLLVVRSSLVPSTVWRTAAVGTLSMLILYLGIRRTVGDLDPVVTDGTFFMGFSIVIATSVSSHVIYGLRAQVRDMTRLGQYTLERQLGEGGMGVVYRAQHGMLRRPTAIKLLPPEKSSAESIERFEREVQLTARLSHPNTVTVFDYGRTPEGVFYYAMELLDGATLTDVIELTGVQPTSRIVNILRDCAGALNEAHALGLIHRDIKPSNIMLCTQGGRDDVVKLLDFGLVKQLSTDEASHTLTAAEVILGTPLYMSPEAIRDPDNVDARSDIYALGAVGYYLLTGTHVFSGKTVLEICAHHLHTDPEPPHQRTDQSVDPALETLVMRCLAKSPDARPQSAAEIESELRALPTADAWSAGEWWEEYRPAIGQRQSERQISGPERTVAVDPRR